MDLPEEPPKAGDSESFEPEDDLYQVPTYEVGTTFFALGMQYLVEECRPAEDTIAFRDVDKIVIAAQVGRKTQYIFQIRKDGLADRIGLYGYLY